MRPYLLDINLLIALAWPSHVHHQTAQRWFAKKRAAGFRTSPLTQLAFVRISSNPRFTPDAVAPGAALGLLKRMTALPEHEFWPDDLAIMEAIGEGELLVGHRQITDAYLLGLTRAHRGILATLDRGTLAVARAAEEVELLG